MIEFDGFARCFEGLFGGIGAIVAELEHEIAIVGRCQSGVRQSVSRVQGDRPLKIVARLGVTLLGELFEHRHAALIIFPGRKIDWLLGDRSSLLRALDFGGDDRRDAMGDLVPKVEYVLDLAIVALGPKMVPGGRVDQLRGDA